MGKLIKKTQLRSRQPISPRLRWNTYAGGIQAREGTHSYDAPTPYGRYNISVVSRGRQNTYTLYFLNEKGKLPGGLWQTIGSYRSPNAAKAAARSHSESIVVV